jgi:hypothetical protein
MKSWLKDLLEEYPTNTEWSYRSDAAIERLSRIYGQYDDETMRRATDSYILEKKYFPKVSDMKPYVDHALYAVKQQGPEYSDEEILAWEQERGTMPPDSQLDTEYEECEGLQVPA